MVPQTRRESKGLYLIWLLLCYLSRVKNTFFRPEIVESNNIYFNKIQFSCRCKNPKGFF